MPLSNLHIIIIRLYLLFAFVIAGTVIYLSGGNRWVWWVVQMAPSVYLVSFPFWKFRIEKRLLWVIGYLLIALLSTIANIAVPFSIIILSKDILFIAGIWTFFAYFVVSQKEVYGILKLLLFTACIQIIWVIPQYFFVRMGRIDQGKGVIASDSVVGSFGGSMTSGGLSATFAFFQVCILIGLVCFRRYGVITDRRRYITFMFLTFIPLLLTETKVIVVYFLLAAVILNANLIKVNFLMFVYNNMKVILLVVILIISYQFYHWSTEGDNLVGNLISSVTYSFDEEAKRTRGGNMTRYQAVLFWGDQGFNNVGNLLFGHGLGASYSISPDPSKLGAMASEFSPLKIDKTGLSLLLWDVGVVGALFVFGFLVHSSRDAKQLARSGKLNAWQQALAQTLQIIFLMFCFSLMYRNDIPYAAPMMVIFMLSQGLLSYISKNNYIDKNG